jgi:hypothetical protein
MTWFCTFYVKVTSYNQAETVTNGWLRNCYTLFEMICNNE